jgi:hypothetical protein
VPGYGTRLRRYLFYFFARQGFYIFPQLQILQLSFFIQPSFVASTWGAANTSACRFVTSPISGSLFASPRRHLAAGFGALAQFATGLWRRTDGEVTALGYSWPRLRASAVNFSANIFLLPVTLTTHKIITL